MKETTSDFFIAFVNIIWKRNKLYNKKVKSKVSNYFTGDIFLFKQTGFISDCIALMQENILK